MGVGILKPALASTTMVRKFYSKLTMWKTSPGKLFRPAKDASSGGAKLPLSPFVIWIFSIIMKGFDISAPIPSSS